jgi:hypothetical protein
LCLAGAAGPAASAFAGEGLWTFDNFPSATVKAKFGVVVDQAWLDRIRNTAVRLSSGCSASIVTAQGLVLTNHDCTGNPLAPAYRWRANGAA